MDALGQRLGDGGAAIYAVADRSLISDTELTSNERMVIRRWSDDGLIEVLPAGTPVLPRVREISALTGLAMLTRVGGASSRRTRRCPAPGGIALAPHAGQPPVTSARTNPVLARLWRCPEPDCPSYGAQRTGWASRRHRLRGGVPTCPRHGTRLSDAGREPLAWPMSVRVDGLVRQRWAVSTARPDHRRPCAGRQDRRHPGPLPGRRWRALDQPQSPDQLEFHDDVMTVTDSSTNGTTVLTRTGPGATPTHGEAQIRSVARARRVGRHQAVRRR